MCGLEGTLTLITGAVSDISGTPSDGVLHVRSVSYRRDGSTLVSTDCSSFPVAGGVLSAEVSPGLCQFTLAVSGARREWIADVADVASVGLGDLLGVL